jgi:hypothetical protein
MAGRYGCIDRRVAPGTGDDLPREADVDEENSMVI